MLMASVVAVQPERDWRGEVHIGTQIRAHALSVGEAYFEVRVYRGAREHGLKLPGILG